MSRSKLRRQSYTDANVQGRLVRRLMLHWLAFFVVTVMSMAFMHMLLGDPEVGAVQRLTNAASEQVLIGLVIVALLPAFMLDTIRFSNRFVGPIGRLRQSMRKLAAGENPGTLHFREDDFWMDAAEEFNMMARRMVAVESEVRRMRELLDRGSSHPGNQDTENSQQEQLVEELSKTTD